MKIEVYLKGAPIDCDVDYSPAEPTTHWDEGRDESIEINSAWAANENGDPVDVMCFIEAWDLLKELKQNALNAYHDHQAKQWPDDDERQDHERDEIAEVYGVAA